MGFKEDEQFLRYLTMGAAGSAAVAHYMTDHHGHRIVELERYTMANKLWATKVKRLRLPDLMCIDCGLRIEARAKSKLEIKVSDSEGGDVDRVWDAGLRDMDLIAFVYWDAAGRRAAGRPEMFTVGDMRSTIAFSKVGGRKAVSEGSEIDRTWTARCAKSDGEVLEIEERKVKTRLAGGRRQSYWLPDGVPSFVYVTPGESFPANERFLLGVVPPPETLDCPGDTWAFLDDLQVEDAVGRYAAVKTAGIARAGESVETLVAIAEDSEDWRLQLEALASLARIDPATFTHRVADFATSESEERALAMEATFVLSELGTDEAADALVALADDHTRDAEARSAAVWGLGIAGAHRPDRMLKYIADEDDDVALHALAGFGHLPESLVDDVVAMLDERNRAGAAAAALLARQGEAGARALLAATSETTKMIWALVGLGHIPEAIVRATGELSPEIEDALRPTWASREEAWLGLAEGGQELLFMERQTIRHKPPDVGQPPEETL